MLAEAGAWLAGVRSDFMSRAVTYQRSGASISLRATVGASQFVQDDQVGPRIRTEMRDYLIRVTDLVVAATQYYPQVGDRIIEVIGAKTCTFEAMTPPTDEPAWRYSDEGRTTFRIHTKLVGEA